LQPLTDDIPPWVNEMVPSGAMLDPEQPLDPETLMVRVLPEDLRARGRRRLRAYAAVGGLLGAAVWALAPLEHAEVWTSIAAGARQLQHGPLGVGILSAGFLLGTLLPIPVTLLVVLAVLVLGPYQGAVYALAASLLSALAAYGIGRSLAPGMTRRLLGRRIHRFRKRLHGKGLAAVLALRLMPAGPFAWVNLASGAARIGFGSFLLGTVIGMLPGVVLAGFLADQFERALREPDSANLVAVTVALGLAAAGLLAVERWLQRRPASRSR
jgi:phospholipase D1/2